MVNRPPPSVGHSTDVVADVLFIGQHLANGGSSPRPVQISEDAFGVEPVCDSRLEQAALDEPAVDLVHDGDFRVRAGLQDHAVGLQALVLAARHLLLHRTGLVDQHTAQAVARRPALAEAEFDQAALARELDCLPRVRED